MDVKIGEQKPKLAADGRPKPCCTSFSVANRPVGTVPADAELGICLDEKRVRDECMFQHEDGMVKCEDLISAHRKCMAGFGYKV